jgi:mycoredoxin
MATVSAVAITGGGTSPSVSVLVASVSKVTVSKVTMYSTVWCGYCRRLKAQLDRAGIDFDEVDIEHDATAASFVAGMNGGNQTVPTVLLPDGSVLTNPTIDQIVAATAA